MCAFQERQAPGHGNGQVGRCHARPGLRCCVAPGRHGERSEELPARSGGAALPSAQRARRGGGGQGTWWSFAGGMGEGGPEEAGEPRGPGTGHVTPSVVPGPG